jgi:hypothetical protein
MCFNSCAVSNESGSSELRGLEALSNTFSQEVLSIRDEILDKLEEIAPEYYKVIGASDVPAGFREFIKQGSGLWQQSKFGPLLSRLIPEIVDAVTMRLNSELRRPSNVLYAPWHILMQLLRGSQDSQRRGVSVPARLVMLGLKDISLSVLAHRTTEAATNYYLFFMGLSDYVGIDGAVDILEQYWLPRIVKGSGEGTVRNWGDDQDSYYPKDLKRIEDFIALGIDAGNGVEPVTEFLNLIRSSSSGLQSVLEKGRIEGVRNKVHEISSKLGLKLPV